MRTIGINLIYDCERVMMALIFSDMAARVIGFDKKPSMPDLRQRSSSSFNTLAVMAMIFGVKPSGALSRISS